MEIFGVSDGVLVQIEPGCPQEFIAHGIPPLQNGLLGLVVSVEPGRSDGHYYGVGHLGILGHPHAVLHFTPTELRRAKP